MRIVAVSTDGADYDAYDTDAALASSATLAAAVATEPATLPPGTSFSSWCDCSLEPNLHIALYRMHRCFLRLYDSRVPGKAPRPPPKPPSEVAELSLGSIWLVLSSVLAVGMFGCLAYFLFCVRHTTASAFTAIADTDKPGAPFSTGVPVARIHSDGRSSIVRGVVVGSMAGSEAAPRFKETQLDEQRQALLGGGIKGF
jgi:hypothetical protein